MSYFGLRDWDFNNQNINNLSKCLKKNRQANLEFDMATIDWHEYFQYYLPGIKKYFLKEINPDIGQSKRYYQRYCT